MAEHRILAIDDDAHNVALLRAVLVPAGYAVTTAGSLATARDAVRGGGIDLVLLDRHLPDGDGLDLARELKSTEAGRHVPVLLVSASVLPVDRTAAEAAGCDGFIDKPIRIDDLLDAVQRWLGGASAA